MCGPLLHLPLHEESSGRREIRMTWHGDVEGDQDDLARRLKPGVAWAGSSASLSSSGRWG